MDPIVIRNLMHKHLSSQGLPLAAEPQPILKFLSCRAEPFFVKPEIKELWGMGTPPTLA